MKSPSDTTIYAPALKLTPGIRRGIADVVSPNVMQIPNREMGMSHQQPIVINMDKNGEVVQRGNPTDNTMVNNLQNEDIMTKVANFVDQLWIQHDENEAEDSDDTISKLQPRSRVNVPGLDEAQRRMEQAIVETEKFKATVEVPPGRSNLFAPINNDSGDISSSGHFSNQRQVVGAGLSDDDFFHLTCHIDSALKGKIEKGEFVDLDKLLPKDNSFNGRVSNNNETKLEWVQSEGSTYLVPASKASRINCFRRWEQAFRMYATIYCTKNPSRAREIWQYVSIINTASMSYNWDNVYHYDIVFRQLMEFNLGRSWAVTYNQMWNLSMTTPINTSRIGEVSLLMATAMEAMQIILIQFQRKN